MDTHKELFLLSQMNVLRAVTANLAATMQLVFAAKGGDLLGAMHHNMRESMRLRGVVLEGDPDGTDPIALQTMMLAHLDEFFRQAHYYAEKGKSGSPQRPPGQ